MESAGQRFRGETGKFAGESPQVQREYSSPERVARPRREASSAAESFNRDLEDNDEKVIPRRSTPKGNQ
jgi:hypothetical protein